MSKLHQLQLSIENLVHDFGGTDHALVGLVVNVALGALGVAVWVAADGWLAFGGAVWAILHILAIGKWMVYNL